MVKLKAFIVEDEKHNRDSLMELLDVHFKKEIEVVGSSGSILETASFLQHGQADILFLDIELADGQVFDLLSAIDYKKYKLIFITGYSEHAIKAIRFAAVDYLLKPIIPKEFIEAIKKVSIHITENNPVLNDLISRKQFNLDEYLIINNQQALEKITINNITYLKADGTYTEIYHENKKTISSKPIGVYEDVLPQNLFNRCHKSYIVNKHYIKRIGKGRSLQLTLYDGTELPVAVRKKEEFNQWFKE
ncbi:MAG: LytTR family DNA-binding domain-containing protein [Bacteroidota bacterium]|nr:LytTR family DNA-binding domain-containing protein [Bacteroidota bacterium]